MDGRGRGVGEFGEKIEVDRKNNGGNQIGERGRGIYRKFIKKMEGIQRHRNEDHCVGWNIGFKTETDIINIHIIKFTR